MFLPWVKKNARLTLLQRRFARDVVILAGGTALARAVSLLSSPILTRLYTPKDFGVFATFSSIAAILAVFSTFRYELAIPLPAESVDAASLAKVTLKILVATTAIFAVFFALFGANVTVWFKAEDMFPWVYILPLGSALIAAFQIYQMWLNRLRQYRRMALMRLMKATWVAFVSVALGIKSIISGGLIVGFLAGNAFSVFPVSWKVHREHKDVFSRATSASQRKVAIRYLSIPKYVLISHLISTAALQIPVFLSTKAFSLEVAGFFSIAYKMVNLPSLLIASAVGDVYRQRVAELYAQKGEFKGIFLKTLFSVAVIAFPLFLVLFVASPSLFGVVFGERWRIAGEYARILTIEAFFQFVFTPTDKGALVVGATRYIFIWHLTRFIAYMLLGYVVLQGKMEVRGMLMSFVGINSALYLFDGIIEWKFAQGTKERLK